MIKGQFAVELPDQSFAFRFALAGSYGQGESFISSSTIVPSTNYLEVSELLLYPPCVTQMLLWN
jgi:hypothetical protein